MDIQRPDDAALTHLKAELSYVRSLLTAHLRRMQRAGLLPPPDARFPGTSIAPDEVEARLAQALSPEQYLGVLEETARLDIVEADQHRRALAEASPNLPLVRLKRAFSLSDDEYLVVLLSVAGEFEPTLPRLFGYLQNHFERQYPTLALLADCLLPPGSSANVRWILDPEGTLRSNALVRLDDKKSTVPVLHQAILSDPRIVRYVQGFPELDEKLATVATLQNRARVDLEPILPQRDVEKWTALMRLIDERAESPWDLPVFVLRGPPGVGKHHWSRAIAAKLGMNHLRVELTALASEYDSLEWGLRVALREAQLQEALLCLDGWERLTEARRVVMEEGGFDPGDPSRLLEASRVLGRVTHGFPGTYALAIEDTGTRPPQISRPLKEIELTMPDLQASIRLWTQCLPKRLRAPGLTSKKLAQSFRLTPGQAIEAVAEAVRELDGDGEVLAYEGLSAAIKRQVRHRLGENAALIELDYRWEDLVIPADVDLQLRELIGRWRQRITVFETWGLGRRFGTGQGLSVLFEGPPGTGKTMAASIVAGELDLDLYQIDLSKVVSRYVGETEKNLGRIFDEAERARAMLLFDEADSLFSSRTAVKSANDRYANLEVNYLLQRVEHFTGIAVLTTNFPTGIDEAFRRRIAMRVSFPKPEVPERTRLWASMLTNRNILADNIDPEDLAYEFELAGGHIKNAVLRAAFIAATRGCRIDQDLLRIAARIELKEQGLLVHGSPYDELRAHKA
ncbi:MAG: AAA family ATPase [Deltaproteobacteria bacterium]|nr:MAG: AAA family ATPase [Deltaproteobacteria bacterium]